jgi:uncharacterized membrane protein YoaK (UPF0700 family)
MDPRTADTTADASSEPGSVVPERLVVRLLAVLSAAAGCLDAVCVTRLGGAFASVITGNVVQVGRGIGTLDVRLAAGAAVAVGGYALGVAAASFALGPKDAGWRLRTSLVAAAELALLACVAAGWLAVGGRPGEHARLLLLAMAAAAMGVQSMVTITSGVPDASTTYLTGTLTTVIRTLISTPHQFAAAAGGAGRLAALLCGAVAGALLLRVAPLWAPVLPPVLLAAVVVITVRSAHAPTDGSRTPGR